MDRERPGARKRPQVGLTRVTDYRIVDTREALHEVVEALESEPRFALDTEFHRERTYWPKVALVQIAWPGDLVLIDPLAVEMGPLAAVFDDETVVVAHAAAQDLEVLENCCGAVPARLFDTQLAAGFLGMATPSLAALHERELGLQLPKSSRLTDWLVRPLRTAQLDYAASDVAHLLEIHDRLTEQLTKRGRLSWAEAEFDLLLARDRGPATPTRRGDASRRPAIFGGRPFPWPARWRPGVSAGPLRSTNHRGSSWPIWRSWQSLSPRPDPVRIWPVSAASIAGSPGGSSANRSSMRSGRGWPSTGALPDPNGAASTGGSCDQRWRSSPPGSTRWRAIATSTRPFWPHAPTSRRWSAATTMLVWRTGGEPNWPGGRSDVWYRATRPSPSRVVRSFSRSAATSRFSDGRAPFGRWITRRVDALQSLDRTTTTGELEP